MYKIDSAFLYDFFRTKYADICWNKISGKSLLPFRYILDLTYRCNLKCKHCYISKNEINKNELTTQEWKNIIKQIPRLGIISLIGGEVFLRKDFFEILKIASEHTFGKINTYSNGLVLNEEILQKLFSIRMLLFAISIDGYGKNHDINRSYDGLFENITNSLDIIRYAKKNKNIANKRIYIPLCQINTVILENNLDDLPLIYKLAAEHNIDYVGFLFKRDNYRQNPEYMGKLTDEIYKREYNYDIYFDLEHFNEIYKELMSLKKIYKTEIRWSPRFENINQINFTFKNIDKNATDLWKPCKMPFHDVFIDPEGIVYPCIPLKMGSLRENSLKEIINNKQYCEFRKKLHKEKLFNFCKICCDIYPKK